MYSYRTTYVSRGARTPVLWQRYVRWWRSPWREWSRRRKVAVLAYSVCQGVLTAVVMNLWVFK